MHKEIRRIHFIGICGTAMGSVAAALQARGYVVSGSDRNVYPPMSTFLASRGITLLEGFRPENLPDADLIVIGNAVKRGNPEVEEVLNRKLYYLSLPETLKGVFSARQPQSGRHRHPWKNDDNQSAGLVAGMRRKKSRLHDRWPAE